MHLFWLNLLLKLHTGIFKMIPKQFTYWQNYLFLLFFSPIIYIYVFNAGCILYNLNSPVQVKMDAKLIDKIMEIILIEKWAQILLEWIAYFYMLLKIRMCLLLQIFRLYMLYIISFLFSRLINSQIKISLFII